MTISAEVMHREVKLSAGSIFGTNATTQLKICYFPVSRRNEMGQFLHRL